MKTYWLSKADTKIFRGKRVLVSVCYDVGVARGKILDMHRLESTKKTITHVLKCGASRVILLAYRGRPNGRVVPELSLEPVARVLSKMLAPRPVDFIGFIPKDTKQSFSLSTEQKRELFAHVNDFFAQGGSRTTLLENVRFFPEDEQNNPVFARALSSLGDIFVNEAFASSHRNHAHIVGISKHLPTYYGFQFEKETTMLSRARNAPHRPLLVILGGAKLETKLPLIKFFLKRADKVALGGKLLNEFMEAQARIKNYELRIKGRARRVIRNSSFVIPARLRRKILWPVDCRIGRRNSAQLVSANNFTDWKSAMDIGLATLDLLFREIDKANTIIWNGPIGKVEKKRFATGTEMLARHLVKHAHNKHILAGGGDTLAALDKVHALKKLYHISTGGGAMLEFLAKGKIVGFRKPGSRT